LFNFQILFDFCRVDVFTCFWFFKWRSVGKWPSNTSLVLKKLTRLDLINSGWNLGEIWKFPKVNYHSNFYAKSGRQSKAFTAICSLNVIARVLFFFSLPDGNISEMLRYGDEFDVFLLISIIQMMEKSFVCSNNCRQSSYFLVISDFYSSGYRHPFVHRSIILWRHPTRWRLDSPGQNRNKRP
jgi:hypothetical protein